MDRKEIIHILLIDDDEDDAVIFKVILKNIKNQKYSMTWIDNYESTLVEAKKKEYDIIFVDYNLGRYTGLDLMPKIQEINQDIPIIMLTGRNDHEIDMIAMKKGVSDFITKSKLDAELLERSIRYAIEKKKIEKKILYLAYYDQLTNLPNRTFFKEQLNYALAHAIRYKRIMAVCFLDLDNFKLINDSLGHHIGDELLKQVAQRLCVSIRKGDILARNNLKTLIDTVARQGGDEFTISLTEMNTYENASVVAERVITSLKKSFNIENHEVFTSVSIGISLYPADSDDADTLIKYADNAMYYAKKLGKNSFQYYQESMNKEVMQKIQMSNRLRKALVNDEFLLNYQPKMDTLSGKIIGYEALIRWKSPEGGLIPPAQFIPFAEEHHLIADITDWVLHAACRAVQKWKSLKLLPPPVSINVPINSFNKPNFVEYLKGVLHEYNLTPESIELEVTESIFIQDMEYTNTKLRELQDLGFKISIDDFGTGFSSLNRLKEIHCDILKIDKSFVDYINAKVPDTVIINSIIFMGHGLKMQILAEGVETIEQFRFLKQKKCNSIQGYLLSCPLPEEKIEEQLRAEKAGNGPGIHLLKKIEEYESMHSIKPTEAEE